MGRWLLALFLFFVFPAQKAWAADPRSTLSHGEDTGDDFNHYILTIPEFAAPDGPRTRVIWVPVVRPAGTRPGAPVSPQTQLVRATLETGVIESGTTVSKLRVPVPKEWGSGAADVLAGITDDPELGRHEGTMTETRVGRHNTWTRVALPHGVRYIKPNGARAGVLRLPEHQISAVTERVLQTHPMLPPSGHPGRPAQRGPQPTPVHHSPTATWHPRSAQWHSQPGSGHAQPARAQGQPMHMGNQYQEHPPQHGGSPAARRL